jgi:phenylalanyl-tRNA synthetase alpha chain
VKLIDDIRQIFVEMGFQEIQGDYVESCFWNMDVLFIPQDHPAREMQDTFYCKTPARLPITEKPLLEEIARVHENGGKTGSTGWGASFSKTEGERALLRTHTTVNTIRYLYHHPTPPCKVFSLERVFRKENIDTTHLPEFYQIEGIIHEEHANFRQLIGILKEFYHRIGFEKIRFRPGYFPYTEPSMEVEVFWNGKWMELGGSGIFRPEVTEPVGVKNPVLAWGLGLERLAMLRYGLNDIRSLYISDIDWLRNTPLV